MNARLPVRQALPLYLQSRLTRLEELKRASDARARASLRHIATHTPDAPRAVYERHSDALRCAAFLSGSINPLWRCHRRGCLVCADVDGARLRREVERRLLAVHEARGGEYRLMTLVLHCGDVPDNRPDLGLRRLNELQRAVTKLQRLVIGGAPAILGAVHSFEVSRSEVLADHAHPHLHALLLVRCDVHEGQIVSRLRKGAITDALLKLIVDYQDPAANELALIAAAAKYCAYMVKVAKTSEPASEAHCAFVDMVLARRRRFSRWGLLKPSSEETAGDGVVGEVGEVGEVHDDEVDDVDDCAPPQTRAAWRWSPFAQMYVEVNDSVRGDDQNDCGVVSLVDEQGGGGDAG